MRACLADDHSFCFSCVYILDILSLLYVALRTALKQSNYYRIKPDAEVPIRLADIYQCQSALYARLSFTDLHAAKRFEPDVAVITLRFGHL